MFNYIRFVFVFPVSFLHWLAYKCSSKMTQSMIDSDVDEMNERLKEHHGLQYYLILKPAYRNLFYYRLHKKTFLLRFFLKPYPLFFINAREVGPSFYVLNHPYGTIINAKKIGAKFVCRHLTTIGNKKDGESDLIPTIGDNVVLGANVTIIGNITIGDNVEVGAGSVVVKDVPPNVIVAGNPARIIRER